MPTQHEYPVAVDWTGGRGGKGKVSPAHSGASIDIAVPPEFQGPGGGTSPEELLTCAIASCYSITFGIIAENRKLPVANLHVDVTGEVEQNGPSFKFTSVNVKPKIRLQADATDEQVKMAEDLAHKADAYCIITNAVRNNVQISVEPEIRK